MGSGARAARVAVDPGSDGPIRIRRLDEDGTARGEVQILPGPEAVAALERELAPRWVLARARSYRRLLEAGVSLGRAHDVELTEGLLVGADGRFGAPHGLAAATARLAGREPEPDPPVPEEGPPGLFDDGPRTDELADVVAVHAAQQRRLAAGPPGMRMLVAAESTGALVAEEMRRDGLPWRADVHDRLLTDVLGPRPVLGGRPPRLAELAREISEAFGGRALNPDSPAEVLRAFARAGHELSSTRAWEVRRVEHPAVAPLLAYKELARLHAAHGWSWLRTWVRGDRFHPEYVVGGVVSGRWATRGGGALQIPRAVRAAVRADPGWRLVVADAAQLEPRVLAAMAREPALAPDVDDLYSALAAAEFGGDRARAKLGLLGAMYGQTSGGAAPALATLRRRFPAAMALLEDAARAGEQGRLVRSHLGRTCPPARPGDEADAAARARGRFTRNFVVQATAAEWALVLLAELRHALRRSGSPAQLVFFQHDEVLLHVPAEVADDVAAAVHAAAATAGRRLFGDTAVRFPMQARVVSGYDEKDSGQNHSDRKDAGEDGKDTGRKDAAPAAL
ncbi:bifunctional 3'-5' exonuclease/DNA polymerase [Pseudonocardia sp. KRD291]|uniref:bifunctional 3'-5' exonuclease/DNA polymerase n=1 Tax=Pseudonocardia sp. KRD291 TaxID=2792007 RepID=UPI001C49E016|nr:bifunctional 3'-5' exonuclease/DNA polymerase [Pseudonocardia sp. KRD291]MBW0102790.1 bifunctional 3'-5' exonuclease/DNA polymerase [Pseudonocardia sp. KRD291]